MVELRNIDGRDPLYEYISPLGQGGFGTVIKVRRISDSKIMACKTIDCSGHPTLKRLAERELNACASLKTEKYIARFSDDCAWSSSTNTIRIYMDFYEGGDLQKVIDICRFQGTAVHPIIAAYWCLEIARGVKICHDRGIIHRDIKPQNVLLSTRYEINDVLWNASNSGKLDAKDKKAAEQFLKWMENRSPWCHITDFGLGKFSPAAMIASRITIASLGMVGTPGYIAPESMDANPVFSAKSDVYSLGCLFYSLCTGKSLFSTGVPEQSSIILRNEYPNTVEKLIKKCLSKEPSDRPTSREVVNELSEAFMDMMNGQFWSRTKAALQDRQAPFQNYFNQNQAIPKPLGRFGRSSETEDFMAAWQRKQDLKSPAEKEADRKAMEKFQADWQRKEDLKTPEQKEADRKVIENLMAGIEEKNRKKAEKKAMEEFMADWQRKENLKSPAEKEADRKAMKDFMAEHQRKENLKTAEQKLADKKAMEEFFGKKKGWW